MSLIQTLIVLFIGLFVIKPADIPILINKIKKIKYQKSLPFVG